jgi:ABC-type polysaccharide/polyol phosphate export permease
MMGSILLLFLLGWVIIIAALWVYFEDYNNRKDQDL